VTSEGKGRSQAQSEVTGYEIHATVIDLDIGPELKEEIDRFADDVNAATSPGIDKEGERLLAEAIIEAEQLPPRRGRDLSDISIVRLPDREGMMRLNVIAPSGRIWLVDIEEGRLKSFAGHNPRRRSPRAH
jgi:hypothetical protein